MLDSTAVLRLCTDPVQVHKASGENWWRRVQNTSLFRFGLMVALKFLHKMQSRTELSESEHFKDLSFIHEIWSILLC